MKIYLQSQIFEKMEYEHTLEYIPPNPILGRLHFHDYLISAYNDYHKNHLSVDNFLYDHDELCIWCNLHAAIHDICAGVIDYETCKAYSGDQGCEYCLSKTTWYKKL